MKNAMKTKMILPALIVAAFSIVSHTTFAQTAPKLSTEEVQQVLSLVKSNVAVLVDVRTPEEFKEAHLEFAKNIDFKAEDFTSAVSKLDKNKTIYLYCRSGNRSGKALEVLKSLGFKSVYNIGGLEDLRNAGLPSL